MTVQPEPVTRRMKRLIDPIHLVAYQADEPTAALEALGLRHNYWDGYFAGRAAPLGLAPAEVVHAIFYNFADGEVAWEHKGAWPIGPSELHAGRTSRMESKTIIPTVGRFLIAETSGRAACAQSRGTTLVRGFT